MVQNRAGQVTLHDLITGDVVILYRNKNRELDRVLQNSEAYIVTKATNNKITLVSLTQKGNSTLPRTLSYDLSVEPDINYIIEMYSRYELSYDIRKWPNSLRINVTGNPDIMEYEKRTFLEAVKCRNREAIVTKSKKRRLRKKNLAKSKSIPNYKGLIIGNTLLTLIHPKNSIELYPEVVNKYDVIKRVGCNKQEAYQIHASKNAQFFVGRKKDFLNIISEDRVVFFSSVDGYDKNQLIPYLYRNLKIIHKNPEYVLAISKRFLECLLETYPMGIYPELYLPANQAGAQKINLDLEGEIFIPDDEAPDEIYDEAPDDVFEVDDYYPDPDFDE